jgi:hypothetical protein
MNVTQPAAFVSVSSAFVVPKTSRTSATTTRPTTAVNATGSRRVATVSAPMTIAQEI